MTKLPQIFSDQRFKVAATATAAIILLLIVLNVFIIGGDEFIYKINSGVDFPLAIITVIAAASIWRTMSANNQNRILWSGIVTGWALWALAETIWAIYTFLEQEPYPSPADFFWVIGYIPMGFGLVMRARTMPDKPTRTQYAYILALSAFIFIVTLFAILNPIIQDFAPDRLLESILNLTYPLADLILINVLLRLFFTYEEGDYAFSWRLLALGFMSMTLSDLLFTYTTWQEIYYPDGIATPISRVTDVSYTMSYLIWIIGIYALGLMKQEKPVVEPVSRVRVVRTYGHILVYTKGDDTVLDISPNFGRFFQDVNVVGKPFANALTISEQSGRSIMEKLRTDGKIADLPIQVKNFAGAMQEMRLSGVAIMNPQKGYLGCNLLLRTRVKDASFDDILDQPSKAMVKYLLEQSGSENKAEIAQFLVDYYLAFIKALLDIATHEGGASTAKALLERLQTVSNRRDWKIKFDQETVLEHADYPLETLREALPILLETAKTFVSTLTDPASVEARLEEVDANFSDMIKNDAKRYLEEKVEIEFANHRKEEPKPQD